MQFRFQPLRAAQAAGVLVRKAGGRLNYTKLLKLLHLADRKSLLETGEPMTGDSVVNMKNGPVLSNVYRCIKDDAPQCTTWKACFRTDGYDLVLTGQDPGDSELSDYDIEVLDGLYRQYESHTYSRMIDVAHALPEWEDPAPAARTSVSHEAILRAQGATPEKIRSYDDLNASMKRVEARRVIRT